MMSFANMKGDVERPTFLANWAGMHDAVARINQYCTNAQLMGGVYIMHGKLIPGPKGLRAASKYAA